MIPLADNLYLFGLDAHDATRHITAPTLTMVCADTFEGTRMTSKQFWSVLLACLVCFGLFTGVSSTMEPRDWWAAWRPSVNKHGGITYGRDELNT